ncbi:MAG: energy transducer TonB [Alistipes sp.]
MATNEPNKPIKRPRMRLPFENKKADTGEWAYDHRIGLCITLIAYLILAIAFVAGKIVVGSKPQSLGMYIDLQTLSELEQERDRLEQEVEKKKEQSENADWKQIQNLVSNENAKEVGTKGSRGVSDPSGAAKGVEERMRANRETYEKGLAEEQAILNSKPQSGASEQTDQRVKGRVTVSYSFPNPVRTHRAHRLEIPAYQCEGGGEVVVEAILNHSGEVISARVESGGDNCMQETALRAARNSRFNIDDTAPNRQIGTITYIFIPQ